MDKLNREEQSRFVFGRQIVDNIVIMQETVHTICNRTGKVGMMAIKVDSEKAYGHFKLDSIQDTLILAGFPSDVISIIVDCITSMRMQVLWNDEPSQQFIPTKGIHQGDPIS